MIVGKLMVVLGLDSTGFNTGISTATGKTTAFAKVTDKTFKAIGAAAKIGMLAVSAAFIKGTIDAAKFEKALANVSTMLDKTTMPLMDDFKKSILALSESYGESTDALAKGLYDILSASIPAAKALDVLEVSAIAAKAGLTDTGVAADAITTLINSFGDATKDANYYSDIMFSTVKFGKCLTGDTRVLLSNGEYRRIDSLSAKVNIVSWDYKTFTPTDAKFVDMGTKQTVEIETKNGRQILTTPEHPYLTVNGWKKVSELKEGDKIAVPTGLPFFGNVIPEEGFPELLGLLLSEGSMNGGTPKLTIGNEHTNKLAREATAKYGIGYNKINQKNKEKCDMYCLSYGKAGYNKKNKLTERLRSMGIWGDTCHTKRVPDEVFTWKKEYIAKFLNAYFTGDGWLCSSGSTLKTWQLGVCSVSKQLLNDISHLLLRFGVNGAIRKNSNNAYVWEAHRFIEIKRFMEFIGIQRDGLEIFNNYIPKRAPRQYKCLANGGVRTTEYPEYKRYRGIKSENNLLEYIAIKRIEYKGIERVYDLMVPVLHNFVANDILAHNTTFEELAPVIGNVAKVMETAGGTAEEMAAMLAIMTRNGIKTRVAVTSLRGVVSALLKPSEALTEFLGGMTVKADGFAAVMEKVSSLPPTDLAEMFPNIRALTGVVVAAGDLGDEVEKIKDLMAEGSPTYVAFEKQSQTLAFIWDQFKSTLKATSITIGDQLLPVVKEILIGMTQWFKENREGFANFARETLEGMKNIVTTIFNLKEVILGLGAAIVGIMAIQRVTTLMAAFGIATSISLGPVAAIGIAIGLLVGAFYKLKKAMRDTREESDLIEAAEKGLLKTSEEYTEAIEAQRKVITELRKLGLGAIRGEEQRLTMMVYNAAKQKEIDEAEKARLEDVSQAEMQAFMDTQARMAEEARLEDEASARRRTREADIKLIRDALLAASETSEEKYEKERVRLEELGFSYEEILEYLAIKFPETYEELDNTMDMTWDNEMARMGTLKKVVKKTWQEIAKEIKKSLAEIKKTYDTLYTSLSGLAGSYFSYESSLLDQKEADGKDVAKERYKLAVKQFNYEKAISLANVVINTASAIAKSLPNLVLAAVIGVMGGIQAGLILSTKPPPAPAFIRGGVAGMIDGGVFSGKPGIDTNNIAVTSGEYIMPPQQTLDNMDELEAMRSGEGGRSVTVNPMPLVMQIEGQTVFDGVIEFFTEASDRGEYRLNPKILGANA